MKMSQPTHAATTELRRPKTDASGAPAAPATVPAAQKPSSEGVFTTTILKLVIKPLAGDKVELGFFEKAAFQYPFLKTFAISRTDAVKHLSEAGIDGAAMLKMVATDPQSFTTADGIGLAWREGKAQIKDPTKHYKNFVGLFDLSVGWV
jgi:hypothetical protein